MAFIALHKRSWLLLLPQPAVPLTLSSFGVRNHSTDRAGQAPSGPLKGVKVVNASACFPFGDSSCTLSSSSPDATCSH